MHYVTGHPCLRALDLTHTSNTCARALERSITREREMAATSGQAKGRSTGRKDLTLKEKFELIQQSKGLKVRELAALYGCGKTQVYSVLKNKAQITASYEPPKTW